MHGRNLRRLEHLNTHGLPDPRRDQYVVRDSLVYGVIELACDMGWILQVKISISPPPHAFLDTSNLILFIYYIQPNVLTEHFSRRLTLARTFVNGMASEEAILVILPRHHVAKYEI
jgi:hypothetical protein